jgi:ubiquinone biosynthesis monooxygenase Coq7
MTSLPTQDDKSKAILLQMLDDEAKHATAAIDAGGYEFPAPIRFAMTGLSKVMTKSVYKI